MTDDDDECLERISDRVLIEEMDARGLSTCIDDFLVNMDDYELIEEMERRHLSTIYNEIQDDYVELKKVMKPTDYDHFLVLISRLDKFFKV